MNISDKPQSAETAQPASELAYKRIRDDILKGALRGGDRLIEQRLALDLGISRTPVREALRRLTLEGFVERGSGYSTRVAHLDTSEVDQIFELRALLEPYAARGAARHATDGQIETLRTLAQQMRDLTPARIDDDYNAISEMNEIFHRTIYEASGSPRLVYIMASVIDIGTVARTYHRYTDRDLERSAAHHQEIVEAIEARAPDWAARAMTSHILAAQACLHGMMR